MERDPICGQEEHTHTDECYEHRLICGKTEQDGQAETTQRVLSCAFTTHVHSESCYNADGQLICGYADYAIHTHDENCYDADGNLVCTLPEVKQHGHDGSCYETKTVLACGQDESSVQTIEESNDPFSDGTDVFGSGDNNVYVGDSEGGHTHTEECYETKYTLTCGKDEIIPHTHTAECYDENGNLVCGRLEIQEHQHDENCFMTVKTEAVEGHTHTDECYEDVLICDKAEHEHTEECYPQEEAEDEVAEGDAEAADEAVAEETGEEVAGEEATAEEDAQEDVDTVEDAEVLEEDADTAEETEAVEEEEDSDLVAMEPAVEYICGKEEHTHGEGCWDEEGNLICGMEEHVHDETCLPEADDEEAEEEPVVAKVLTAEGSDYTVEVTYTDEAQIPDNAVLSVREIEQGTEEYESYYQQAVEAVQGGDTSSLAFARFFDISFVVDGTEIEPAAAVSVKISYKDAVEVPEGSEVKSVHFGEETEVLDVQTNGADGTVEEVAFDANGFSVYGILGTTNYALNNASDIENGSNGISVFSIGGEDSVPIEVGQTLTIRSTVTGQSADSSHYESWNSSDETIAIVDGISDGDNQYKQTSATITGIALGEVTITHTYYTTSTFFGHTWWNKKTETITVKVIEPEHAVYTVSFNIGTEAETSGVTVPDSIMVREGETISNLPTLVWKDENGDYVKIFAGWYTDEGLTTEFTSSTPVTSDMTLYASWVNDNVDGMYYVNFYSQDGQTVYLTLAAAMGKTVNPASGPTMTGMVFKGWSITMQEGSPISELNAFDFTTPVSNAVKNGNTLNLYAWYAPAVKVSFISNGGSAVPTQFIAQGETATSVIPTRTGYTFDSWYTDAALTQVYDFTTPVNTDITLYAKWTANMVPVTLVYMYENADDDNYSPAGENGSKVVYAPAGSYLSIEKNQSITDTDATHSVRYSDTADGSLTGYARTAETGGSNATIRDVRDDYYQYNNATNKRYVNPDGSTVVLIYYNRARITLEFIYELSSDASINVDDLISAENKDKYSVVYTETTGTVNNKTYNWFTYKFTAKYRQDITAVWPQITWVTISNEGRDYSTFYTWTCPDGHDQTSNMYTLENSLFNLEIEEGVLVGNGEINAKGNSVKRDWLIYARTTLPGETVDFVYNKKNYTIYTEACQLGYMPNGVDAFGYKSLDGCKNTTNNALTTNYKTTQTMSINNLTTPNSDLRSKFDNVFPNQNEGGNIWIAAGDICQVLLYDRDSLTLTVYTNDTAYTSAQTDSYLYGDWIYNEDTDLLKTLEAGMYKDGYVFAGWYTDPNFTPGTEYNPDKNSRIISNMNLWGKWEPNQFRAEYYLYRDDSSPYARQGFAEGGTIDDKFVPAAVQDQFLGWYWYQNGVLVPFDFTSTVGQAHVDNDGILKLYAMWEGQTGKVSYLPGIGGDNSTQEVFDSRDFQINEAAVQLSNYSDVWTDGSVPATDGLTFVGWKAPNGKIYQPGRYVLVTRQLMQFEAQWSQDAVRLIYDANGGNGRNVTETWDRNSVVDIWDNMDATTPHFTRDDYELIGWDTNKDATNPTYKLGEGTITLTKDNTTLYAIWKKNVVDVKLKKVDDKENVISGAHFKLSKLQDTIWQEVNSDITPGDGTNGSPNPVDLGNLKIGRYKLQETSAPDGYIVLNSDVYFKICNNTDGNLIVQLTDEEGNAMNTSDVSSVVTAEDGSYTITIKNTPGQALPNTGGSGTLPYTLGGIALLMASALMYGFRMRRRERRLR